MNDAGQLYLAVFQVSLSVRPLFHVLLAFSKDEL